MKTFALTAVGREGATEKNDSKFMSSEQGEPKDQPPLASVPGHGHVRDDECIDMLHALKTAFSANGDTEMFLARAGDKVRQMEDTIIETCTKHRLRTDDNLYSLLEARDAIAEQTVDLDRSVRTAADVTATIDVAVADICNKTTIRKNLDAALAVAARTRRLARLYARVEDTIDSKRLYTALRMLRVLEEDMRTILPNTVLQELIPDTRRLRGRIATQTRRSLQSWLATIRPYERSLGAYGMRHAATQAVLHQSMLDTPVGTLGEPFVLLPLLSAAPPRRRVSSRPWIPMVMPQTTTGESTGPSLPPPPPPPPATTAFRPHPTAGPARPLRASNTPLGRVLADDSPAPTIFLRPLLQAVLVSDGLGIMHELTAEYCRSRSARLQQILNAEDIDEDENYFDKDADLKLVPDQEVELEPEPDALWRPDTSDTDENAGKINSDKSGRRIIKKNIREDDTRRKTSQNGTSDDRGGCTRVGGPSVSAKPTSGAQEIELLVCKVAGFFVVERAVAANLTNTQLVSRDTVDREWWSTAYARLLAVFKEYEENGLESATDKAIVRGLEESVERFAEANNLIE